MLNLIISRVLGLLWGTWIVGSPGQGRTHVSETASMCVGIVCVGRGEGGGECGEGSESECGLGFNALTVWYAWKRV